jgi:membrane protease YdiL (CAAX protease family)
VATLGWGLLLVLFLVGVQLGAGLALTRGVPGLVPRPWAYDGDLVGVPAMASAVLGLPAIAGVIALGRRTTVREALALAWPGWRALAVWVGAAAAVGAGYDALARAVSRPVVPPVMVEAWRTADWRAALCVGVVVAAPLLEEALFRGFLFTGLAASRLGLPLAIVLPAAAWALLHVQYDAFDLSFIFVLGVLLGVARWRSGSLAACLAAHVVLNLVATIQVALLAGAPGPR